MSVTIRRRSPRAPSIALGEAIEKASKIYDMERCHVAPVDIAAQHIGYKDAGNGSALSTLASLKYYGLIERPKDGMLAVSKDLESYRFAPNDTIRQALILKWLKSPPIFSELLEKYAEGLPSDATVKFDLIQRGFVPSAADVCLQVFRRSIDFAHFFELSPQLLEEQTNDERTSPDREEVESELTSPPEEEITLERTSAQPISKPRITAIDDSDRIPVRLTGGRRAWIHIPTPFFQADKDRLKKQIDLLLTDDEESDDDVL